MVRRSVPQKRQPRKLVDKLDKKEEKEKRWSIDSRNIINQQATTIRLRITHPLTGFSIFNIMKTFPEEK
jgi:hypothetical protein